MKFSDICVFLSTPLPISLACPPIPPSCWLLSSPTSSFCIEVFFVFFSNDHAILFANSWNYFLWAYEECPCLCVSLEMFFSSAARVPVLIMVFEQF